MEEVLGALCIAVSLFSLVVFAGFSAISTITSEDVKPHQIEKANELCENNGGVSYYEYDPHDIDVVCMNGAEFHNIKRGDG